MKEFLDIRKNVPLTPYTTFKIGGPAKYFYEAKNSEDLIKAVKAAKKTDVPFFILGAGSNVLASDEGFDGLVIKIQNTNYKILNTRIVADAGVLLSKLVNESVKIGLTGLEWAIGIPGTLGGAIRGNTGAFNNSIADAVKSVLVLKLPRFQVSCFGFQDLKFGYRDSIFKHNKNLIILSAELKLKKGNKNRSREMIREYLKKRQETQPLEFPSAGCIFKNPKGYSAGWLIEQCGLKGKKSPCPVDVPLGSARLKASRPRKAFFGGKAMISKKHANFIVNLGGAKASDVKKLIDLCKEKVREKFKINLEEEIEYLGEF